MSVVEIKKCDGCGITDDVRKVNDFYCPILRNGVYIGRSETFQLCNQCDDNKLALIFSTVHVRIKLKRGYHKSEQSA
jgi:hypothetical protein